MADRLETAFRELADAAEPVGLRSATDVRRRGNHRRRSVRAGAVVAVAILAVGVVGVVGTFADQLQGAPPATSQPPAVVATHPLLPASQVAPIGPYESFEKADAVGLGVLSLSCLSAPRTWGDNQMWMQEYYSPLDATFTEIVLEFPDEASATTAAARPLADFADCTAGDPTDAKVADRSAQLGIGDQSYQLARSTTPTGDADLGYNEIAVARRGSVVVVLDWRSQGAPTEAPGWAWTPEQLQMALDQATNPS